MTVKRDEHAAADEPEVPGVEIADPETPEGEDGEAVEADGDEAAEAGEADAGDDDDDEGGKPHGIEFTPEQQKAFDRAMSRKQRKLHEARERAERVEQELAAIKSERDALNAKVGDDTVLAAMQQAGVLPDYVTAEEAKVVGEAENLKARKRFLKAMVRRGEEYTGQDANGNERTWSVEQLEAQLDAAEDRLESIGGRAAAIRQRIVEEYREDSRRGRELRGKDAGKPRAEADKLKPKVKAAGNVVPPMVPPGGGERRSDPVRPKVAGVDWSKVTSKEELLSTLEAEERTRLKRGR